MATSLQPAHCCLKIALRVRGPPWRQASFAAVRLAMRLAGLSERVSNAKFFSQISYRDVLHQDLKVMDSTAISLCMDNGMPIVVFNMNQPGNIKRVVLGERVGSTVTPP